MAETPEMSSSRPYLIRALHEWISDNGMTPLLLVDADAPAADVPRAFVEDGKIILNVSMSAVQGLELGDDRIQFRARFSGAVKQISVPVTAVLAVYARETSAGMMFPETESDAEQTDQAGAEADTTNSDTDTQPDDKPSRPHLRVIK